MPVTPLTQQEEKLFKDIASDRTQTPEAIKMLMMRLNQNWKSLQREVDAGKHGETDAARILHMIPGIEDALDEPEYAEHWISQMAENQGRIATLKAVMMDMDREAIAKRIAALKEESDDEGDDE